MRSSRHIILLLILLLLATTSNAAPFKRIASVNLCTDQLLYLLEDEKNIASVSYLSADPDYSYLASDMQQFHLNYANVEELIPLNPDLILAGSFTDSHVVHFLRHLGYRVEQVEIPFDMQHIEQAIIKTGILLGREQRAHEIIQQMQQRRQAAEEKVRDRNRPLAIILAPNGFTHGKGSMKGDLLELAGYRNLAAEAGISGNGNINLETLVDAQPDYLIIEDSASNNHSMAQHFLKHPALSDGLPHMKRIYVHPNLWTCGGPSMIDALEILVEAHP